MDITPKISLISIINKEYSNDRLLIHYLFKNNITNKYIIASSSIMQYIDETMFFVSDSHGKIIDCNALITVIPHITLEKEICMHVVEYWFPDLI